MRYAKIRWVPGLPCNETYFYDEPVPEGRLIKKTDLPYFPYDGMDLSDAWTVKIITSDLTPAERGEKYPAVFGKKGNLRVGYIHKGKAAEMFSETAGRWVLSGGF